MLDCFIEDILNFIGASVRWIWGSLWRTLFRKKKFTFAEYLNGPKNSEDWFHDSVNYIAAIGFLAGVAFLLISILT